VLQKLQDRFGGRGLRVLGFPCNDFAAEEPDDLDTIKAFCKREYGATYPLYGKVHIREDSGYPVHPLYQWLTAASAPGFNPGPVSWNFEKFIIDRDGCVSGRFPPKVQPNDPTMIRAVEDALKAKTASSTG
jgi:glutathione peroxidase